MTYHPSHGHIHVDNWADFTLRSNNGDPNPRNWPIVCKDFLSIGVKYFSAAGHKVSFCLINIGSCLEANNFGGCENNLGEEMTLDDMPNYGFGVVTGRVEPAGMPKFGRVWKRSRHLCWLHGRIVSEIVSKY
jgi:hypothetical protein